MAKDTPVQTEDVNEEVNEEEVVEDNQETESEENEEVVEEEEVEESEHEKAVPYSRFKEVIDSKNTLQGMVATLTQLVTQNQGNRNTVEEIAKPEDMDDKQWETVKRLVKENVGKNKAETENLLGGILDKLDEVKATASNPEIKKHLKLIDEVKNEYAQGGAYITREQAYRILVGDGRITPSQPGKKVSVKKTQVTVTKEKTNSSGKPGKSTTTKEPKQMSEEELDTWMGDKKF